MLTVLTEGSIERQSVRHDHGGTAGAASHRPLLTFGQVIEQHDQLVKCQTCVWNEVLKKLKCRTQALAPGQIWKARLRIRYRLIGQHFQHLAYASDRIGFSSQPRGPQQCSQLTRGGTRWSPGYLLRPLPPLALSELAYTIRRQPGPRADRARARLVQEHPHGEVEAAQVAAIGSVGDTHGTCVRKLTSGCVGADRGPGSVLARIGRLPPRRGSSVRPFCERARGHACPHRSGPGIDLRKAAVACRTPREHSPETADSTQKHRIDRG